MKRTIKTSSKVFIALLIVSLAILAGILISSKVKEDSINKELQGAKYICYTVKQFDTLWDIAKEYNEFDISTRDYISKIFEINNLKTDKIKEGEAIILVVPNR